MGLGLAAEVRTCCSPPDLATYKDLITHPLHPQLALFMAVPSVQNIAVQTSQCYHKPRMIFL